VNKTLKTLALAATIGACLPASAASTLFDFSNLALSGNVNVGFLPTDGVACSGGDLCSSNIATALNGDLTFLKDGITVFATASYNGGVAAVVQDHENGRNFAAGLGAGLGVYHKKNDNSDDNITVGESLSIRFDQDVTLGNVYLRSEGHNTTWANGATFLLNGQQTALTGTLDTHNLFVQKGTEVTFAFNGNPTQGMTGDQFYLGGMSVTAVPEPGTYALLLVGLAVTGAAARRKRG
jgi:PEP-CTERM motif